MAHEKYPLAVSLSKTIEKSLDVATTREEGTASGHASRGDGDREEANQHEELAFAAGLTLCDREHCHHV